MIETFYTLFLPFLLDSLAVNFLLFVFNSQLKKDSYGKAFTFLFVGILYAWVADYFYNISNELIAVNLITLFIHTILDTIMPEKNKLNILLSVGLGIGLFVFGINNGFLG